MLFFVCNMLAFCLGEKFKRRGDRECDVLKDRTMTLDFYILFGLLPPDIIDSLLQLLLIYAVSLAIILFSSS